MKRKKNRRMVTHRERELREVLESGLYYSIEFWPLDPGAPNLWRLFEYQGQGQVTVTVAEGSALTREIAERELIAAARRLRQLPFTEQDERDAAVDLDDWRTVDEIDARQN